LNKAESKSAKKSPPKKALKKRKFRAAIPNQIRSSGIPSLREELLRKQEGICPLCKTLILPEEAALDHCHSSGVVRSVLHRWCNAVLGRVENWSKRVGKTSGIEFLENSVAYLKSEHSDIIHPTHGKVKRRKRRYAPRR